MTERKLQIITPSSMDYWQSLNMKFEKTEKIAGVHTELVLNNKNSNLTNGNIRVHCVVYGSGINGNLYQLSDQRLAVFDIYDIDNGVYLLPEQRWKLVSDLGLPHVPLKGFGDLIGTVADLLDEADGMSSINPECIREGFVYKSMVDANVSFKVVSDAYLIKKG